MKRAKTTGSRKDTQAEVVPSDEIVPRDEVKIRFIERPNGVFWRASGSTTEYGPFSTLAEAEADAQGREDPTFQVTDSVAEAEAEIGISEWIDPDTGVPAEESVPRIEDH